MALERKIEQKMITWLDGKLRGNGLAQDAVKKKDARVVFTKAMEACVGIREKTGKNDGPEVEMIQDTIGGVGREAWCMALIQTCIAYAEVKTGVKSPLFASEHCLTVWAKTPKEQRVKSIPLPGAVIIWQHGKTTNGHTGIVLGYDAKVMQTVEGNTTSGFDAKGNIEREGGGVYYNQRSTKANGSMKVVGFLIPFPKA